METHDKHRTALEREADEEKRKVMRKAARAARALDEKVALRQEVINEKKEVEEKTDEADSPLLETEGAEEEDGETDEEAAYDEPYPAVAFSGGEPLHLSDMEAAC